MYKGLVLIINLVLLSFSVAGQCPETKLFDQTLSSVSAQPVWVNCIDNESEPDDYDLTIISPEDIENYTLDFGDGTPVKSGTLLPANTPVNHSYPLGNYTLKLTQTKNGCTDTLFGKVVNDRKPGASALPPTLGTSGCVPHTLTFTNKSTNTSAFTKFEWDWGDNTTDVVGHSNVGQAMSHEFQKGRSGCGMVVKLTAYGLCDTTFSSYGPYDFWDTDTALVEASATEICGGEEVTFTDLSNYNCNVKQPRRIRWDFREVGGPRTDWLPATPDNRKQSYFISGDVGDQFTVIFEDSNYCGVDRDEVTVTVVEPPQAAVEVIDPVICAGEKARFENKSAGGADLYVWDFGAGADEFRTGTDEAVSTRYESKGKYNISLISAVSATSMCRDTVSAEVEVLPSSVSDFSVDVQEDCAPYTVTIKNESQNASGYSWDFGPYGSSSSANPAPVTIDKAGTYEFSLFTSNSIGCGNSKSITVSAFSPVKADFKADTVCLGNVMKLKNHSELTEPPECAAGNILWEKWSNVNGQDVTDLTGSSEFSQNPDESRLLDVFEAPSGIDDQFGAAVRGYICPPMSGNYIFWISSDDKSELYLSDSESPDDKSKIAYVNNHTSKRQWTKYSNQQSEPVYLRKGRRYYIEALHKESGGNDHLAVGWQLPDGNRMRPVPGDYLSPFKEGERITDYTWKIDGNTKTSKNLDYNFTAAGTYNVRMIAETGRCMDSVSKDVVVLPSTSADFNITDTAGCSPFDAELANFSTGGENFVWDFDDDSSSVSSDDTLYHEFNNIHSSNRSYWITLTSITDKGCRDSITKGITVYPAPKADFEYSPILPLCSPAEIDFINRSAVADTYTWTIEGKDSVISDQTFDHVFYNTTDDIKHDTVRLVASANTGCYNVIEKVITTYPEPDFSVTAAPDTGCAPLDTKFSVDKNLSRYLWEFGNGNLSSSPQPEQNFVNYSSKDSIYKVTFYGTSIYGCEDTIHKDIVVHPSPEVSFSATPASGCSPHVSGFYNMSEGAEHYIWKIGENNPSDTLPQTFDYEFHNAGSSDKKYEVTLTGRNNSGCADSISRTITVYPQVTADFDLSDSSGCSPLVVDMTESSDNATTFNWDFGNGSGALGTHATTSFSAVNDADTSYTIRLVARNSYNCSESVEKEVKVFPSPVVSVSAIPPAGCSPFEANFNSQAVNADNFSWSFPDTSFASAYDTAVHTFTNTGNSEINKDVWLKGENSFGCTDSSMTTVTVYPEVTASFAVTDSSGCSPLSSNFFNNSTNASGFNWSFGNGLQSTVTSPIHMFLNQHPDKDTTYMVELTAFSAKGCQDTDSLPVTVFAKPSVSYYENTTQGCSPLPVEFFNTSSGAESFKWYFPEDTIATDDNTVSYEFTNTADGSITVPVSLEGVSEQGCTDRANRSLTVFPYIIADFESDTAGCTPFSPELTNKSKGAVRYIWRYGGGRMATEREPSLTFENYSQQEDSVFTLKLITQSQFGCTDTASKEMTIYARPYAGFTADNYEIRLPDTLIYFENESTPGQDYSWNFGNETTSTYFQPDTQLYAQKGEYPVQLIVSNPNCSDTSRQQITVLPHFPIAGFTGESSGCGPLLVEFVNESRYSDQYYWDFGDGYTGTEKHPVHEYQHSGTYTVALKVKGEGGEDQVVHRDFVEVYPDPNAYFEVKPNDKVVKIPDNPHYFLNLSTGGVSNEWDFGDGSGSAEQSPYHYYQAAGEYDVTLTVTNEFGCKDVFTETGAAIAEAGGKIALPNAFTPSNGGNLNSAGKNDIFKPLSEGIVEYKLQIFNRWGELLFESENINHGWDGTYRGELCKQDVYVYKVYAKFIDGEKIERVGDVTLIR